MGSPSGSRKSAQCRHTHFSVWSGALRARRGTRAASGNRAEPDNGTVWRRRTGKGRLQDRNATGNSNMLSTVGMFPTVKPTKRVRTRLQRHGAKRPAFVAPSPEQAGKMT